MPFSVLILVKNRHDHLLRVLDGIKLSTVQPSEIIIVHMNEAPADIATDLPIRQLRLDSAHQLPLAAARNVAARAAPTDTLLFLDVDCIPAADYFTRLLNDLESAQFVMADPRYLTRAVQQIDYAVLEADGRPNPARNDLKLGDSDKYELFWSLGFAIRSADFITTGGFDEAYTGYGAEDTDFAFRARRAGLRLRYSQARIYHQNHPSYDPPLNWLADIVSNARRFREVWGSWPMEGWLQQFVELGYISWSEDTIRLKRLPTADEIAAARKPDAL